MVNQAVHEATFTHGSYEADENNDDKYLLTRMQLHK